MRHSSSTYAKAFLEVAGKKEVLPKIVGNFLKILKKNNDFGKLPEVIRLLEIFLYKKNGISKVEIITARDIQKELEPKIHERFGKNAEIDFVVRPEIIGGVIIKMNEEIVIDASIKRRLAKLFP